MLLLTALLLAVIGWSASAATQGAGLVATAAADLLTGARNCRCDHHRRGCARCALAYRRAVAP